MSETASEHGRLVGVCGAGAFGGSVLCPPRGGDVFCISMKWGRMAGKKSLLSGHVTSENNSPHTIRRNTQSHHENGHAKYLN